jgi:hypothetical protein
MGDQFAVFRLPCDSATMTGESDSLLWYSRVPRGQISFMQDMDKFTLESGVFYVNLL